jgi:hypothetical protein
MQGRIKLVPVVVAMAAALILGLMVGCTSPNGPKIENQTVIVPVLDRDGAQVNVEGVPQGLRNPVGSRSAQAWIKAEWLLSQIQFPTRREIQREDGSGTRARE